MFSGIVAASGEVTQAGGGRLSVMTPELAAGLRTGDSVAVNGVCLTVAELSGDAFTADVIPETMHRSTLGALRAGDRVNLERALALGDVVGGHLVSGHVDAVGRVTALREDGNARWATIAVDAALMPLLAKKGSVALDGISLTVVDVFEQSFTVSLIPHTLRVTNAASWTAGTRVNIEVDPIARYVQRVLAAQRDPAAQRVEV